MKPQPVEEAFVWIHVLFSVSPSSWSHLTECSTAITTCNCTAPPPPSSPSLIISRLLLGFKSLHVSWQHCDLKIGKVDFLFANESRLHKFSGHFLYKHWRSHRMSKARLKVVFNHHHTCGEGTWQGKSWSTVDTITLHQVHYAEFSTQQKRIVGLRIFVIKIKKPSCRCKYNYDGTMTTMSAETLKLMQVANYIKSIIDIFTRVFPIQLAHSSTTWNLSVSLSFPIITSRMSFHTALKELWQLRMCSHVLSV